MEQDEPGSCVDELFIFYQPNIVIFHSYVELPNGISPKKLVSNLRPRESRECLVLLGHVQPIFFVK
jgi:hypothetical protein